VEVGANGGNSVVSAVLISTFRNDSFQPFYFEKSHSATDSGGLRRGDAARRRAAIDELYTEDCVPYAPGMAEFKSANF
jgi:hypothetical protein